MSLWTAFKSTTLGRVVYPSWRTAMLPVLPKVPVLWRLRLTHPLQLRSAAEMNASLLTWVDGARTRPFFAFVNYMDAHIPYTPPDSFRRMFRSQQQRPPHPEAGAAAPSVPLTPADVQAKLDHYEARSPISTWRSGGSWRRSGSGACSTHLGDRHVGLR